MASPPRRAARRPLAESDGVAIRARVSSPANDGGAQEYRYSHSGRDSDLEAFSRNPPDGSLAPLAYQPSTYTKCPNLRFLSY